MYTYRNDTKLDLKDSLIFIGICILIIFLIRGCEAVQYNDGIHSDCGGHWVYQDSVGHHYFTSYIFKCDKCGKFAEFDETAASPIYFENQSMEDRNKIELERKNYISPTATPTIAVEETEEEKKKKTEEKEPTSETSDSETTENTK